MDYNYLWIKYDNIVIELKVTELKKEHIGQIQTYMDKNIKTIGIIIVKKENKFIMEYCSNDKIFETKL